MKKKFKQKLQNALEKRAVGYDRTETVEIYEPGEDEGTFRLKRKKITVKSVPPDSRAAKIILDEYDDEKFSSLSDEQLEKEKLRLIKMIAKKKE